MHGQASLLVDFTVSLMAFSGSVAPAISVTIFSPLPDGEVDSFQVQCHGFLLNAIYKVVKRRTPIEWKLFFHILCSLLHALPIGHTKVTAEQRKSVYDFA